MGKSRTKEIECVIASEKIRATLRHKFSITIGVEPNYYVECNQEDCQYAGENKPPCPLSLELFADEMSKIKEKRQNKKAGL
ncbi:MAG: hypothetical protein IEMM0002_0524 [bacterium]|nr:MAG: hypothetical protein IEMM0002_0524 [bacterium]